VVEAAASESNYKKKRMEEFTGFLAAVGSILFFGSYGMKNLNFCKFCFCIFFLGNVVCDLGSQLIRQFWCLCEFWGIVFKAHMRYA
jgi:hypothetical protein